MICVTILKEWVKLRFLIVTLGLFTLVLMMILAYQTHTLFLSSEPEALLWHRFVFFNDYSINPCTLGLHQLVSLGIIIILGFIISIELWLVFMEFYPDILLHVSLYDNLWSLLGGCLAYLGGSVLVMEPKFKILLLKALFIVASLGFFVSLETNECLFLWFVVGFICLLLEIDSILAISNKHLKIFYPLQFEKFNNDSQHKEP